MYSAQLEGVTERTEGEKEGRGEPLVITKDHLLKVCILWPVFFLDWKLARDFDQAKFRPELFGPEFGPGF
jgi:hypothetical protein